MRAAVLAQLLVATVVTSLGVGCGGVPLPDTPDLSETVRQFNDGVRWERFASAASALPPRERSQFVDDMDQRADELKITDYEVVRLDPHGDRSARVQVKLTWYKVSEGTVHETHAVQTWERHGRAWWMVDATRLRGAEMPGLREAPERPVPDPPVAARSAAAVKD
jgi:hypothetical protein